MAWLPTPGFPQQDTEPPVPPAQGDMWGTLKQIMSQVPQDVGMQPMPIAYVPSAPSFISQLAKLKDAPKMLLPEEITSSKKLMDSGMNPLSDRRLSSLIDKWGNSWMAPRSHEDTILNLMNSKNDGYLKPMLQEWLYNKNYWPTPNALTDYPFIRKTGTDLLSGVSNAQVPLNASKDSLLALSEVVRRGSPLGAEFNIPIQGMPGKMTTGGLNIPNLFPFKQFMKMEDGNEFWKTFKKFDSKEFMDYTQKLNERVLEQYPKYVEWLKSQKP